MTPLKILSSLAFICRPAAGKELTSKVTSVGAWDKGVIFPVGRITIKKSEPYHMALRAATAANWGGLQVFNITIKRVQ
jgi:hypothetical protein